MKKIKTDSYFVTIYESEGNLFIRRRKRKGVHAYPRTLSLKEINKVLNNTQLNYPKLLKNSFKYVNEEYIKSTKDINELSNLQIMNCVIDNIVQLSNITVKNKKIIWNNNSEFLKFTIDNFKKVLIMKSPKNLETYLQELDKIYKDLDDDRKLCFIHGDMHRKNMIICNEDFYLIDWELATYGDLAYELATHFMLIQYTTEEKDNFINKLSLKVSFDIDKLKKDIEIYTEFESFRRDVIEKIKRSNN